MRLAILLLAMILAPMASAMEWGPEVTYSDAVIEGLEGEEFTVKFGIKADENATYSIKLGDRSEFVFDENPIEIEIPDGDTRTFIFDGVVQGEDGNGVADGKYAMTWEAFKNGTKFNSGDFEISAGEQAPSVGIIAAIAGIGIIATLRRRN
ncbi:MAG TPA: hypothetical protein QGI59_02865 [Candidatus Poseidoniia archaeon]|jgi:hypothetical protein|nr:hypothetical protein [Candidatus Poseidoniia archaeon]|tara:strand:+ start:1062 stop:1514 length:453 start_codon:yes stop_codon:yes gene_type:complete